VNVRFGVYLLLSDRVALIFRPDPRKYRDKNTQNYCGCFLYAVKRWSLELRRERKLKMVGNLALRSVLAPKVEQLTVDWGDTAQ
jgi:hypothetical protein